MGRRKSGYFSAFIRHLLLATYSAFIRTYAVGKPETRQLNRAPGSFRLLNQQPEQSAQQSASGQQASCFAPVEIAVIPSATTTSSTNAFSFFMISPFR